MISKPSAMKTFINGHIDHANTSKVKMTHLSTQTDVRKEEVANLILDHHSRYAGVQAMFAELLGVRHLLEFDQDAALSSPISAYNEHKVEDVRECIPMLRKALNQISVISREISEMGDKLLAVKNEAS